MMRFIIWPRHVIVLANVPGSKIRTGTAALNEITGSAANHSGHFSIPRPDLNEGYIQEQTLVSLPCSLANGALFDRLKPK